MNIERSFVNTSRGQLQYRQVGHGPTLLLLQTIPFSSAIFIPLLSELQSSFRCVAIDMMGYGGSDRRNGLWLVEDYADNLFEAIGILGIDQFGIVSGHLSGMVALAINEKCPERVTGLMIDGISALSRSEAEIALQKLNEATAPATDPTTRWHALLNSAWALIRKLDPEMVPNPTNLGLLAEAALDHARNLMGASPFDAAFRFDAQAALSACQARILLLSSNTDTQRRFHVDNLKRIANGVGHVFQGINPLYQLDRPDRTNEYSTVVRDFFL